MSTKHTFLFVVFNKIYTVKLPMTKDNEIDLPYDGIEKINGNNFIGMADMVYDITADTLLKNRTEEYITYPAIAFLRRSAKTVEVEELLDILMTNRYT